MCFRKTIQKEFRVEGIGLHTSEHCALHFMPADAGTGVLFVVRGEEIPVTHLTLIGSSLGTNLVGENWSLRTIEHLLSALVGLGITDLKVVTEGSELPILDGSAIDYVNQLKKVGIKETTPYNKDKITSRVEVFDGVKKIVLSPREDDLIQINFAIDFDNKVVSQMPQEMAYIHNEQNYYNQVASARTFGFKKDLDYLLSQDLVLGGSLENAILIDEDKVINKNGLRFGNEIVAHKILDIIGDLYPIMTRYEGFNVQAIQAGHSINNQLLKAFFTKS